MVKHQRLASAVLLALGIPLLAAGLALGEPELWIGVAILTVLMVIVVTVRIKRNPVDKTEGAPWWFLLPLVLVPLGLAYDMVVPALVGAGALLVREGVELAARALLVPRTPA